MSTWQAILIILGALVVGSVVGLLAIRLIFLKKQSKGNYPRIQTKNNTNPAASKSAPLQKTQPKKSTPLQKTPLKKPSQRESTLNKLSVDSIEDRLELLLEERKKAEPPVKPMRREYTGILAELINNLSIATTPLNGKLLLFQTKYWDNNQEASEKLINNYKEELTQAYTDIRLANVIVWLSNDLGHTSPELEKSYSQLCTKIADRLNNIVTSQISDKN
jgi:hypothetical protein